MNRNANLMALACAALFMAPATLMAAFAILAADRHDHFIAVICTALATAAYVLTWWVATHIEWMWWKTNIALGVIWTAQIYSWAEFISLDKNLGSWCVLLNVLLYTLLRPYHQWKSIP